jgi:DNA-binding HxlR family transcriptional regulator
VLQCGDTAGHPFPRHLATEGIKPMTVRPDKYCPIARTLEVIGERWTFLILRDLVLDGPRKFQDLERSLTGISPNTLSARLKTLEENGIVERRFYADHPPRAEYVITTKGRELRPILKTLKDWGERHTHP